MILLSELKQHLGSGELATVPDADAVLVGLEEHAVDFLERETGRHFGPSQTHIEHLDGSGGRELFLNEAPGAITSVEYRCEIGDDWTALASSSSDGWELRDRRLLRKGGYVWARDEEYRVTYDFGYAEGEEPPEIRGLVIDLVAHRWRQRGIEGHSSGGLGDYRFSAADLDGVHLGNERLDRWRWVVV